MSTKCRVTIIAFAACLFALSAHAAESTVKIPAGATVKIDGNSAMISGGGGNIVEGNYNCSCSDNGGGGTCTIVRNPSSLGCGVGTDTCKKCIMQTIGGKFGGPAALSPPNSGASKGGAGMKAPAANKQ